MVVPRFTTRAGIHPKMTETLAIQERQYKIVIEKFKGGNTKKLSGFRKKYLKFCRNVLSKKPL